MCASVGANLLDKVVISLGLFCFQVMNDLMVIGPHPPFFFKINLFQIGLSH